MNTCDCVPCATRAEQLPNSQAESERDTRHNSQELCEGAHDLRLTLTLARIVSGSSCVQVEVRISLVLLCQLVRTQVALRQFGSLRSGVRPEGSGLIVESGPTDSATLWVRQFAVRAYITLSPAFELRTENMCIVRRTVTSPGTEVRDAVRMNTITSLVELA